MIEKNKDVPEWISEIGDSVIEWLKTVNLPDHPGYYRYSKEGALLNSSRFSGLGFSCLALRTYHIINKLDQIDKEDFESWVQYIKSFQRKRKWGRKYGFFEDKTLLKTLDKKAGWLKRNMAVRRAETRQACGTLLSVGEKPYYPIVGDLPQTPEQLEDYIRSLPWDNPWHSGSHTAHLIFFLKLNSIHFGYQDQFESLIPVILKCLDRLQDKKTGTWYTGSPSSQNIINGAMKVLTGYILLEKELKYPEQLIDTGLNAMNEEDACHNLDLIHVFHSCLNYTSYRQSEIRTVAEKRLDIIRGFMNDDGAFSFHPGKAGTHYYGVEVSRGFAESDVHGTNLFVWTIAMLAEIIGFNDSLNWKLPVI
ncbi:hypothetical protein QUF76_05445 [Desulfobacterales bacterium HSG16]|nr:hypothetical protein [Desulfobacterales bacterium HSG16]